MMRSRSLSGSLSNRLVSGAGADSLMSRSLFGDCISFGVVGGEDYDVVQFLMLPGHGWSLRALSAEESRCFFGSSLSLA